MAFLYGAYLEVICDLNKIVAFTISEGVDRNSWELVLWLEGDKEWSDRIMYSSREDCQKGIEKIKEGIKNKERCIYVDSL